MILDIHTHKCAPRPNAIVSLRTGEEAFTAELLPEQCYSVGVHPWDLADCDDSKWKDVCALARLPQVVAIGECGVDLPRGGMMFRQLQVFRKHVELSEELHKPLIIHDVKGDDIICGLRRDLRPSQSWAVHGFRGKPVAAEALVRAGCYLSFGQKFNAETLRAVPADRILAETDESPLPIEDIISILSEARGEDLTPIIKANSEKFCNFES